MKRHVNGFKPIDGFHLTSVKYINTWSSLISTRSTWLEPLSCEDKSLILHEQRTFILKQRDTDEARHPRIKVPTTHPPQRVWIWRKPREHFQIHYNHIGGELLSMISEKDDWQRIWIIKCLDYFSHKDQISIPTDPSRGTNEKVNNLYTGITKLIHLGQTHSADHTPRWHI